MNIRSILVAFSLLFPFVAVARLGEKLPELIEHYGQPVLVTTTGYEFKSGNLKIIVLMGKPAHVQAGKSMEGCSIEEQITLPGAPFTDDALNEILSANGIDDGKIVKDATRESASRQSKDGARLAEFNIDAVRIKLVGVTVKKQSATGY